MLDGLWMKNPMPTVTVEPAYLTNPSDARLLGEQHFLDAIDTGLRDGLRHYFPAIAARNQAIQANQRLAAQLASARLAAALQGARFRAGIALLALAALILLRRPGAWVGRRAGGALAGSVEQLVYPPSRRAHRRQRQLRRASLAASDYNAGHRHYARARR